LSKREREGRKAVDGYLKAFMLGANPNLHKAPIIDINNTR